MIELTGQKPFTPPPSELWQKLRDARFLVEHVPDLDKVKEVTETQAECVIRPGFAFLRGKLDVALEVVEAVEPTRVRFLLKSKGIGSSSDAEVTLDILEGDDSGSLVNWKLEVTRLGGLLKAVPGGLIRGAAEKVIGQVWNNIDNALQTVAQGE